MSYLKEERQRLILEAIQGEGQVTVAELSRRFGTSQVTIRRDLLYLARRGLLLRTHRGALVARPALTEPPVVQRMDLQRTEKEAIGRLAATLVQDGESIFIGSGSTTLFLAINLFERRDLTVVTNSLSIAQELTDFSDRISVVLTGGVLRREELSLLGHIAELALLEIRFDKVFLGMQALSLSGGLTTEHLMEVTTTRKVIESGRELVVLADHTKLGRTAAAFIAPLEVLSTLVTNKSANPAILARLSELGIRVLLA